MVHIFYPALESLIKEIDGSPKILEKSSTTKIGKHISYRYSMSKIWAFDHTENKDTLYCG